MATNLCSVVGGNTGGVECDTKRKVPKKILVGGKAFSSTEYATASSLQTAILASINLPTGDADKLYPFPEIGEVAVNTEADTTGSLALGAVRRLRKGRPSYTYSVEIGQLQYQNLLAFDGKIVPVFTFDDANNMWGYRAVAAANTPNTNPWRGEKAYVTISGNGFEDGANATTGVATITVSYLSVDDFEKRGTYASLPNLAAGDMEGLKDVMLSEPQAHSTNVYKIKMSIPMPKLASDLNIHDDYGSTIAGLTWAAGTGANFGTTLDITSVAVDNTLKCLTVTFDSDDYSALTNGDEILLTPPNVSALVAAGVTGIEIGSIILTK
jgi:hypothetical protein